MFFGKKKGSNSSKRNEIDNKELKESLADAALGILVAHQDYEELKKTFVTFGYLFDIDNHGLEGLFKVDTDKTTAYFAVQGSQMMRVNLNEEQFRAYIDTFLSMHKSV